MTENWVNNRVYWLAKYIRKSIQGKAYNLSIQQVYLLLTFLGGKHVRRESFLVCKLRDFILSSDRFRDPSRIWLRTKKVGECKFRSWIKSLAFFAEVDLRSSSTLPTPISDIRQLHRFRRLFYSIEADTGFPLLLDVTQNVTIEMQPNTEELHSLPQERVLSDFERILTAQERGRAKLYEGMPFPIVASHHRMDTADSHHSRFVSALRCAESVAAYCAVIAVVERFHLDSEPPFSDRQTIKKFFTDRHMAFGSWLALLRDSADVLFSSGTAVLIPEVLEFARSPAIGTLKELKRMRDMEDAHAMPYSESVFANKLDNMVPIINRLFGDVTFFQKYPLAVVRRIDNLATANRYEFLFLTGTATDSRLETRDCPVELRLAQNGLYTLSSQCISARGLEPFLVYEACEICNQEELFFLDVISHESNRATYRCPITNHRISTEKYMLLFDPS